MAETKLTNSTVLYGDGTTQATARGVAAAWVLKNDGAQGSGNQILSSYNVSSLSQVSAGRWQVNFSITHSSPNYIVNASIIRAGDPGTGLVDGKIHEDLTNRNSSACTIVTYEMSNEVGQRFDWGFSLSTYN